MKKYLLFTIIILCNLMVQAQKIDTISFSVDDVELFLDNGYTRVFMNSCETTLEIGNPELPCLEVKYILPYRNQIASIVVIDSTKLLLSNNIVVYPKQPEYPISDTEQHEFVGPNLDIYESDNVFPHRIVELSQQYYEKGYHIAKIHIYPISYSPKDNELELYTNIRFQINYEENIPTINRPKTQAKNMYNLTETVFFSQVRNKSDFLQCERGPMNIIGPDTPSHHYLKLLDMEDGVHPEYIIITNDYDVNGNLIENSEYPGILLTDVFQELADWKTEKGIPTKIVTIDDISANYSGNDIQEKIHNFLADVYDNYGPLYVLFGGDTNIVPERMLYSEHGDYDLLPSDLYYVAVGSTWNDNCNDVYGEVGDIDSQYENPQFFYGRAPIENIAEAKTIVDKSYSYENMVNIPSSQRDYVNNIVAMARGIDYPREIEKGFGRTITEYNGNGIIIGQFDYGIVQDYIEKWRLYIEDFNFVNDVYRTKVGDSWEWENYHMVFSREPALSCFSSRIPLSSEENPKYGHFVFHIDHSSYLNMGTSSEIMHQTIDRTDVDGFSNAPYYQIVYTGGCYPGEFQKDCITERFINNPNGGAVAMFASSSTSSNDYKGFVGMLKDMYYYVDNNVTSSPQLSTLGALHDNNLSKGGLGSSFCKRKHHLFGDPTIAVWTREPVDLTINTTPSTITNQSGVLTVSINGIAYSEYATNDVDVCVMKEGEVYLRKHYDGTAHNHDFVFEDVKPETPGELKVTVTGHNYIPYETTIPVTIIGKNVYILEKAVVDVTGNGDGNLDAGETVNLSIALKNNGTINLTNVTATLTCELLDDNLNQNINNYLTVITSTVNYGTIVQNATETKNDFQLTLSNVMPDCVCMRCTLAVNDGSGFICNRSFTLPICAPKIEYVSVRHEEKPNGRIGLDVELNNLGYGTAKGVAATLTSPSSVQITQGSATYGEMDHLEAKTESFEFIPNGNIDNTHFTLTITDAYNKSWFYSFILYDIIDTIENLTFTNTEHSIKLKWDPVEDSRGYYVYRSKTANGNYERLNSYPVPSAVYPDLGLEVKQTYYYGVSYLDEYGNESEKARITAWTSLPIAKGWPITIPDNLGNAWGTAPNLADVDGDGKQEIFLTTGTRDQCENMGIVLGFNSLGEELYDIDHNPTTISGFANLHISMTCTPAIGDIDNDGIMEVVVATRCDRNDSNYKLCVYKNVDADNDGAPDLAWERPIDYKNFNGVVLADLDDNGTLEIIASNQGRSVNNTHIEVYNCLGTLLYDISIPPTYNIDQKAVTMPIVAHLDNDGHKEIFSVLKVGSIHGVLIIPRSFSLLFHTTKATLNAQTVQ